MAQSALRNRGDQPVDSAAIDAFAQSVAGEVIDPAHRLYDEARRTWNALIDRRPGLIMRCRGTADVVKAVDFARQHDILVAVRGGGHNVAGRALCDDGLVIDLSAMRAVHVDPAAGTARVQGGATLADMDRETHLHGLAVPAGVVSKTGIGGLALGGGVGWLVRKFGPTCDNIVSMELVTADGRVLTVDADSHPDLFWGLRGGGGNFGVVTSFLFKAHPVSTVLGGLIVHPREQAGALLRHYRDFMKTAPAELTVYAGMLYTPDGVPAAAVIPCHHGDPDRAERDLAGLRSFGEPLMEMIQPMPFPVMQSLLDDAFPSGTRNFWKQTFLKEMSDDAIDVLVDHGNRMTSPLSSLVVEYYGGAGGRVGDGDNAFAQRQARFGVGIMAQWTDPAEDETQIAWTRTAWDSLKPFSTGGYLLNFVPDEPPEVIRAAFGDSFERLVALKRKYDPTNFFSLNQNIRAAA